MPPPRVPALGSPGFVAAKAGLASGVALAACALVGNEDHVSAAFVAVVCVSPTVLIGFRRAFSQLLGSALGGAFGASSLQLGIPADVGIPLAVTGSVYAAFRAGLGQSWVVAAFTALFVQAVPRGVPTHTLAVRMEAVGIAVLAATLVNLVVSGWSYRTLFDKRLTRLEAYVHEVLTWAATAGPAAFTPAFALITALDEELTHAVEELTWRRSSDLGHLRGVHARVTALRHLLHVALDLQTRAAELGLPIEEATAMVRWAATGSGEPPLAPTPLGDARDRVIAARRALP